MPNYNPQQTEPAGKQACSNCGETAHLWSDEYENGEYIEPICVNCLIDQNPDSYPQVLLQDVADYTIVSEAIVLDFHYDLEVEFPFDEKKVAASRNPNETRTVTQPSVKKTGTVYHQGEKIGSFTSKSWRDYAEEKARDKYIDKR